MMKRRFLSLLLAVLLLGAAASTSAMASPSAQEPEITISITEGIGLYLFYTDAAGNTSMFDTDGGAPLIWGSTGVQGYDTASPYRLIPTHLTYSVEGRNEVYMAGSMNVYNQDTGEYQTFEVLRWVHASGGTTAELTKSVYGQYITISISEGFGVYYHYTDREGKQYTFPSDGGLPLKPGTNDRDYDAMIVLDVANASYTAYGWNEIYMTGTLDIIDMSGVKPKETFKVKYTHASGGTAAYWVV